MLWRCSLQRARSFPRSVEQQGWGKRQSEVKEEPEGRGTRTAVLTPTLLRAQTNASWVYNRGPLKDNIARKIRHGRAVESKRQGTGSKCQG